MESLNFTALFSLLDKEKQQMLLSQVNLIPTQEKEVEQGASVRVSPAQQSEEKPAPAVSFTAEELLAPSTGKVHTAAQKYLKVGILGMTLCIPQIWSIQSFNQYFNFAIHKLIRTLQGQTAGRVGKQVQARSHRLGKEPFSICTCSESKIILYSVRLVDRQKNLLKEKTN